MFGTDTVLA